MKKHYTYILPVLLLYFSLAGCSKDFWKPYAERVEGGTWHLYDVRSQGFGSRYTTPFTGGRFQFLPAGRLIYTDDAGNTYEGSWKIRKQRNGADEQEVHTLSITVINFQTQDLLSEFFDDMRFTGTNKFGAFVYYGSRTYVFLFER